MAFRRRTGTVVGVVVLDDGRIISTGRRRFDRERLAMGKASDHPNTVLPLRGGYTAGDQPYLVMEYLAGGSLQEVIGRGPMP